LYNIFSDVPLSFIKSFFLSKALDDHVVCGSRLKVMLAEPLNAKEGARKRAKTEETIKMKTKEETEDQSIME